MFHVKHSLFQRPVNAGDYGFDNAPALPYIARHAWL